MNIVGTYLRTNETFTPASHIVARIEARAQRFLEVNEGDLLEAMKHAADESGDSKAYFTVEGE